MVAASLRTVTSTVSSPSICMSRRVAWAFSLREASLAVRTATCPRIMASSIVCAPDAMKPLTVVALSTSALSPSPIWSSTMARAVSRRVLRLRLDSPDAMPPLRPFSLASLSL